MLVKSGPLTQALLSTSNWHISLLFKITAINIGVTPHFSLTLGLRDHVFHGLLGSHMSFR